ncbi:MAG: ATP-dependent Clp protease adapter ClpS [Rubrobacter sp.]|nr:ATP-dependent Clp protease adapter ClpS [Rubrobacter sp.]
MGVLGHDIWRAGVRCSAATKTAPERKTRRAPSREPRYRVILHNDDWTPMDHVVGALMKVIPRLSLRRAVSIMLEAHTRGQAVVIRCHKELAELYREGLKAEGLISTIEPDG